MVWVCYQVSTHWSTISNGQRHSSPLCVRHFVKYQAEIFHRNRNTFLQRSRFRYTNCHLRLSTESGIPTHIHPEEGNSNVSRNVMKISTFDVDYPRKRKLRILTMQFTHSIWNKGRRFETAGICCSTLQSCGGPSHCHKRPGNATGCSWVDAAYRLWRHTVFDHN
jgi:hypothetical protein